MHNKKKIQSKKNKKNGTYDLKTLTFLLIVYIVYEGFFSPKTIGADPKYFYFITLLPTLIGLTIILSYKFNSLKKELESLNKFNEKITLIIFQIILYIIVSYLSFGLIAKFTFDNFHNKSTRENNPEIFNCEINQFWNKKNPRIDFNFKSNFESFRVDYSTIENYDNEEKNYYLKVTATRGIWNYYTVNKWEIVHK